jgi:hypothetical protein
VTRAQHLFLIGTEITLDTGGIIISSTSGFPRVDFNSDGTISYTSNGIAGFYFQPGWYGAAEPSPGQSFPGAGSLYEIRLTPSVGSFATSAVNTWLALTSGVSWSRTAGDGVSTGTIEVRRASTQQLLGNGLLILADNAVGGGA